MGKITRNLAAKHLRQAATATCRTDFVAQWQWMALA
jgi:hypothetical protein